MKLLITGSRSWDTYDPHGRQVELIILRLNPSHVACGDAGGTDRAVVTVLPRTNCTRLTVYKADWDAFGKGAGFIRNWFMLTNFQPDEVVAFWDGRSSGTRHMMNLAFEVGLPVTWFQPAKPPSGKGLVQSWFRESAMEEPLHVPGKALPNYSEIERRTRSIFGTEGPGLPEWWKTESSL
jgi:hypothetical protein